MAQPLPPPPYTASVVDQSGRLTNAWAKWFELAFQRMGGSTAPSNTEISSLQNTTDSHSSSIAAADTTLSSLQTSIDGLNQGRAL